jgi:hypothetical protein
MIGGTEMTLHTLWPCVGLVLAAILFALLFFTNVFRTDPPTDRWKDFRWLAWLFLPVYMTHQFEEHGIDALGQAYAFRASMCGIFGFLSECPIPEAFLTAVNLSVVWAVGLIAAFSARRRPTLVVATYGILFINGVTHLAPAILRQRYNPGVLTSIVLFLPLGVWMLERARLTLGVSGVIRLIWSGMIVHGVLMGSLVLFVRGAMSESALIFVNIANATVPVAVGWAPEKSKALSLENFGDPSR